MTFRMMGSPIGRRFRLHPKEFGGLPPKRRVLTLQQKVVKYGTSRKSRWRKFAEVLRRWLGKLGAKEVR